MLKLHNFTLFIIISCQPSYASNFYGDTNASVIRLDNDSIVMKDSIIRADKIYLNTSLYLQNEGDIFGNLFVCSGCEAYVKNSGEIYGSVFLADDALFVQVVESGTDIHPLDVSGRYSVLINKADGVAWDGVENVAAGADKITIKDSVINMSANNLPKRTMRSMAAIELIGENELRLDYDSVYDGMTLMSNVNGDGIVRVNIKNVDAVYATSVSMHNGTLYLHLIRETDYYKILGNEMGLYLNSMREQNIGGQLLATLDAATNMPELQHIINKSARLNPKRIINPVKTVLRHINNVTLRYKYDDSNKPHIHAEPFFTIGDNLYAHGGTIRATLPISSDICGSVSGFAGLMKFNNGMEEFFGNIYGVQSALWFDSEKIFANVSAGIADILFYDSDFYSNGKTKSDPHAITEYFNVEVGPVFLAGDNFKIRSSVGAVGDYIKFLDSSQTDLAGRFGLHGNYGYEGVDLTYNYSASAHMSPDNLLQATVNASITSDADDAGGDISFSVLHDASGISFQTAVGVRLYF